MRRIQLENLEELLKIFHFFRKWHRFPSEREQLLFCYRKMTAEEEIYLIRVHSALAFLRFLVTKTFKTFVNICHIFELDTKRNAVKERF